MNAREIFNQRARAQAERLARQAPQPKKEAVRCPPKAKRRRNPEGDALRAQGYLPFSTVARNMATSWDYLTKLIQEGKLEAKKAGHSIFIRPDEVEALLKARQEARDAKAQEKRQRAEAKRNRPPKKPRSRAKPAPEGGYLKAWDISQRYNRAMITVYKMVQRENIPALHVGRILYIKPEDFEEALRRIKERRRETSIRALGDYVKPGHVSPRKKRAPSGGGPDGAKEIERGELKPTAMPPEGQGA